MPLTLKPAGKLPNNVSFQRLSLKVSDTTSLSDSIDTLLNRVRRYYNEHQGRYPEARNALDYPIRAYGYEAVSVTTITSNQGNDCWKIDLTFHVKPKPYAFDSAADKGINENVCSEIAQDLLYGIRKRHPVALANDQSQDASEKILSQIASDGSDSLLEFPNYELNLVVHLGRTGIANFRSSIPLTAKGPD